MSLIYSIFNLLTQIFLIFPICFIWINFYFKNLVFSFILSYVFTITIIIILYLINRNKKEKKQLKFKQIEKCKKLSLNLLISNNNTVLKFFKNLYHNVNIEHQLNCLIIKDETNENFEYIFPLFNKKSIELDDLILIIKILNEIIKGNNNNLKIKIICNDYDKNIINFLNSINLDIKLETIEDIYIEKNLENYSFKFSNLIKEKNKTKLSKIFLSSLNRKNTKKFAYAGFTMMIFSFFTFYNIYYSIFSSFLFIIAIYSFCNKKYN